MYTVLVDAGVVRTMAIRYSEYSGLRKMTKEPVNGMSCNDFAVDINQPDDRVTKMQRDKVIRHNRYGK